MRPTTSTSQTSARSSSCYIPPFTSMVAQVMSEASSLTRKSTTEAISSGSPKRPSGLAWHLSFARLRHARTHGGIDSTWRNGVYTDAVSAEPRAEAPGQVDESGLRCAILHRGAAVLAGARGGIDDRAGLASCNLPLCHPLRCEERRAQIHRHRLIELLRRLLQPVFLGVEDTRIVDQHMDQPMVPLDRVERSLHSSKVSRDRTGNAASCRRSPAPTSMPAAMWPNCSQTTAGCLTDQSVAAGNDRDLRHEFHPR